MLGEESEFGYSVWVIEGYTTKDPFQAMCDIVQVLAIINVLALTRMISAFLNYSHVIFGTLKRKLCNKYFRRIFRGRIRLDLVQYWINI